MPEMSEALVSHIAALRYLDEIQAPYDDSSSLDSSGEQGCLAATKPPKQEENGPALADFKTMLVVLSGQSGNKTTDDTSASNSKSMFEACRGSGKPTYANRSL